MTGRWSNWVLRDKIIYWNRLDFRLENFDGT